MLVSIIIPVYNEGAHIEENILAIRDRAKAENVIYEFVLVDDGSADDSWQAMQRVSERLHACRLIRLSRNFGKEAAVSAGLSQAVGEACIVMDSDLQHPPEVIPEMIRLWAQEGYEVVDAVKANRGKESVLYKLFARLFYGSFNKLSGLELEGASDFKLMDRKAVDAWKAMPEHATFFRGMSTWVGFRHIAIPFEVAARAGGKTKWSFRKLAGLAVGAITSFSALPLQLVTITGLLFLIGAIGIGIETLVMWILGQAASGFTTVILLLLIIGSLLMLSLGVIGTYIAKIYDEVKARPRYIIAEEKCSARREIEK